MSAAGVEIVAKEVQIALRDGVLLSADVVLPNDGKPHPAMLVRTPYSRAAARSWTDSLALARAGWAVLLQDCRGRFDSQGDFDPFRQERRDGADTIAWVARQPWCDGRVTTHGVSYLGIAQWLAALERPTALKAMAILAAGWDARDGWAFEGGAFQLGFVAPWAAGFPLSAPRGSAADAAHVAELMRDTESFLRLPPAANPLCDLFPPFRRWLANRDDEQPTPSITDRYAQLDVPVFQVAGWYDLFVEAGLHHYAGMRAHAASEYARRSQRLVIGPWVHTGLYQQLAPEFDFGAAAAAFHLPIEIAQWLRAAADGEPVDSGVRAYIMGGWGKGEWRSFDDWPPQSQQVTYYLSSQRGANGIRGDGRLLREAPADTRTDCFTYDPERPVPTRGGRTLGPYFPLAGPVDQRCTQERDDVLVYTSDVLQEDLLVIGAITANITFATTGRSADVTVKLCDVYPDGRAYNVVDSIRRARFTAGAATPVTIDVGSTAQRFLAGHRLRVEISSSNFPRFDRNPSDGRSTEDAMHYYSAVQRVCLGGRQPSSLTLPVID